MGMAKWECASPVSAWLVCPLRQRGRAACDARPRPSATHQLAVVRGALSGVGVGGECGECGGRGCWRTLLRSAFLQFLFASRVLYRNCIVTKGTVLAISRNAPSQPCPPCIPSTRRAGRHFHPTHRTAVPHRTAQLEIVPPEWLVQVRTSARPLAAPHCSIQGDGHSVHVGVPQRE